MKVDESSEEKIKKIIADFERKHDEISLKVKELVGENESLQKRLLQAQSTPTARHTENSDFMATQLMETEHVLSQERQQVVKAMNQATNLHRQNEQLKRYIQQSQAQYNQAKGHFTKQIDQLTTQTRDLKISEKDKLIKIDELNSKIDGLEKILNTKNDILQQTKDERDQINLENQKREILVDTAKIDLLTQAEQNTALKKQVHGLKGQYTLAERRMIELNNRLVASNQTKDEMGMRLRELEEIVQRTVKREMELGIKERQIEQLAEDYKLELNESKAKITNFAFQVSSLKEQNKNLLDEMGDKIKTSKEEIKSAANAEIQKMVLQIDELKKNEAKWAEDVERSKREKRSAETTLDQVLKSRQKEDRNGEIGQLQIRINEERKLKDKLGEQIRALQKKNEDLRTELVEREEWKKSDLEFAKKNDDFAKSEMEKLRCALKEIKNENAKISQNVISEQMSKEKLEKHLRGQLNDMEEVLHQKNIKLKGQNVDSVNNMAIRELQEELSTARIQLDRWKNEAIQVAQEADTKLRSNRSEVQALRIDNSELRQDLKELVEKNADFARQVSESDRDRAQLNARVITLQQKLKPFLSK